MNSNSSLKFSAAIVAITAALFVAFTQPAAAQKIWIGNAANSDWTSALNWQDGVGGNATLANYVVDAANLTGFSRTTLNLNIASANIGNISFTGNSTASFAWNAAGGNTADAPAILQGNVTVNSGNHTGTVFLKIDGTSTWDIAANSSFSKGGAGSLGGTGTLIKAGAGTLTLTQNFTTGNNPWAGTMRLDAGVLRVNNGVFATGAFGNATATLRLNGGELRLEQNAGRTYTVGSVIVGGNSSVVHTRQTDSTGNNHVFGPLSIGTHTLSFSQSDAGGFLPTSSSGLVFGATTLTGNATFDVLNSGSVVNSMSLGAIGDGGNAFSLTKTGAGTLTLTANSTYSGGTTVSGGTLDISENANALGTGTLNLGNGTTVNASNASRVTYNNNLVIGGNVSLTGSRTTYNGTVALGNATRTLTVTNAPNNGNLALQLQGVISGDGGIIKEGTGGLRLGNTANTFTGDVSVNAGMLEIRSGGSLGNAANKLIINGDGTVRITNQGAQSLTISNNVDVNANFELAAGSTITFDGGMNLGGGNRTINLLNSNNKAINGIISNGGLILATDTAGNGNMTLGGINSYTGDTTIGANVNLTLADTGAFTFAIGASGINNKLTGTGSLTLDGRFIFDLSGAGTTIGNSWTIVDSGLGETFGGSFFVQDFNGSSGLWTRDFSGTVYQFSESTGVLSVIPEPSTWALLAGSLTVLVLLRRRRGTC
jgi:fibronectin-binding autotransporter adhesin